MITNKDAKFIKSLQLKKYRIRENAFIVEGEKNILELMTSKLIIRRLYLTENFLNKNYQHVEGSGASYEITTEKELIKLGSFQSNAFGLAVVDIPQFESLTLKNGHFLAFESLQDPGNLGTIIRIADWYGFSRIICSEDSVDAYNPKVISATMGSFSRIKVHYEDLTALISKSNIPVYGAVLDGANIHETTFENNGLFLFGNESQGISDDMKAKISKKIRIPGYGQAESLNVAVATAVVCDNFRRIMDS